MGSAVRVITRSPIYGGLVRWNAFEYVTNPDTHKYTKRPRSPSEWVEYRDGSLRIVSDDLIDKARHRTKARTSGDTRIRSGGKAKYLLSGLLRCGCCNQNFIVAGHSRYACGSHREGKACNNDIFVSRADVESALLGPIRRERTSPRPRSRSLWAEYEVQPGALIREGTDGGAEGNRTLDLRIANATLSQLSYRPTARRAILAS
jgi:site-specific DNA recombinase